MEEQKKEETLSRLYALRAGMSAIALEKDHADEIFLGYEKEKRQIRARLQEIEKEKNSLEGKIPGLRGTVQQTSELIRTNDAAIKEYENTLKLPPIRRFFDCFHWINLLLILLLLICIGWAIFFFTTWLSPIGYFYLLLFTEHEAPTVWEANEIPTLLSVLDQMSVYPALIGGIVCLIFIIKNLREDIDTYKRTKSTQALTWRITELKQKNKQLLEEIQSARQELDKCNTTLPQLQSSAGELATGMEEQTEKQRNDGEIVRHVEAGNLLSEALQQEYGALIHNRDWENLDYIIYMLETGRADSMKEALQLVDSERRTERIIEAVKGASKMICSTLAESARRLGMLFSQCTERLSMQIDGLSRQMDFANQNLTAQFSDMGKYVSSLTSEVALGNALQAKANESSLAIAKDVHTLKEHADYADWRLRNSSYR